MTDINKQIEEDKPIEEIFADLDNEMIDEYTKAGKLHPDFLPFTTYDLVQCGYPYPTHGEMIARRYGGTDAQDRLLPSKGEYCKVEDVKVVLSKLLNKFRWRKVSEELPENSVDVLCKYDSGTLFIGYLSKVDNAFRVANTHYNVIREVIEWKPID